MINFYGIDHICSQHHKIYTFNISKTFKRWIGMKSAKVSINLNVAKFIVCKSLHS